MKNSHLPLVIILTVLITVILIASVALIVVLSMDIQLNDPAASTTTTPEAAVTTTKKPADSTTTAPNTTTTTVKPDEPTKPTTTAKPDEPTKPTTTAKPDEPTKPTTTAKPDEPTKPTTTTKPITPPPTPNPGLSEISGTIKGDNIDSLGIFAHYVTEEIDKNAKTITLRFTFYLQSYGLRIGARSDNYLIVNGETHKKLATAKIDLPNGSPLTRTDLYEYVIEIEKPDDNTPVNLELEYFWHFQGTYAGEPADWLSVKVDLTI